MANSVTVPYTTEEKIRAKYATQGADYAKQRQAEADRANAQYNSQFNDAQRANYVNYMLGKRDLPQTLANQGLNGGISETAALRAQTNYENNYGNTERARTNAIKSTNDALADALATYRMTAQQNMNDEIAQNRQLRANYEKQLQQEAESRFANTISGYDNIGTIDKLIASIQSSGIDTWRIPYLRARRAELKAAQATASSSGGGGYTYYGGGGSGGSNDNNDNDNNNNTAKTGLANTIKNTWTTTFNKNATNSQKQITGGRGIGEKSSSSKKRTGNNYRNSKKLSDYSWRK